MGLGRPWPIAGDGLGTPSRSRYALAFSTLVCRGRGSCRRFVDYRRCGGEDSPGLPVRLWREPAIRLRSRRAGRTRVGRGCEPGPARTFKLTLCNASEDERTSEQAQIDSLVLARDSVLLAGCLMCVLPCAIVGSTTGWRWQWRWRSRWGKQGGGSEL